MYVYAHYNSTDEQYVGLHYTPTDQDLMNEVAAKIGPKWRQVGIQLGLEHADLENIEAKHNHSQIHCKFSDVFQKWKNIPNRNPPYTWATIIRALNAPLVSECRLAEDLKEKFS